jgi:hypothetical protein
MSETQNPYSHERRPNNQRFQLEFGCTIEEAVMKLDDLLEEYKQKNQQWNQIKTTAAAGPKEDYLETINEATELSSRVDYLCRILTELSHRLYGSFDYDKLIEGISEAERSL